MGSNEDEDVGSAPTRRPSPPGLESTVASGDARTPSQQQLAEAVKGALFEGKSLPGPAPLETGQVLAERYRLSALLGVGGMGEVYRANDLVLEEDVALKFLPARYADNPDLMRRFVNEVRVARQVTHPNVCRVHDITQSEGRSILSMEYIDGEDLSSLLRRIGRPPEEKAYEFAQQLCSGLAAIHDKGLLHRDLKPSNVMIDGRGNVKLADFGLAAVADKLTAREYGDGTPAYMAPEQANGEEVTEQSDIYALGLVLYELISGRHALGASRVASSENATRPAELSSVVKGVPSEVDGILGRCLERDPRDRPSSVREVAAALPGGDPVAAALAAGRAPSVDAVAGVRGQGALKMAHGWLAVAAIAVLVFAFASIVGSRGHLAMGPQMLPADVLEHRARELLQSVGATEDADSFRVLAHESRRDAQGEERATSETLSAARFYYRQSPTALTSVGGSVTMTDPVYDVPGAARITLDGAGNLRSVLVVPPTVSEASAEEVDWLPLFEAAGLDPNTLTPSEVGQTPRKFADRRHAWTTTIDDVPVRIEAASLDGAVVSFSVLFDRDLEARGHENDEPPVAVYWIIFPVLGIFGGFIYLARRAWVRGEADGRSAIRVTLVLCCVLAASFLIGGHASGFLGAMELLANTVRNVSIVAVATVVIYLVVEPYGRRFIPRSMTSWARLARGGTRDPLVARDVLIGVVGGAAVSLLALLKLWTINGAPIAHPASLVTLLGFRFAVSQLVVSLAISALGVLQTFGLYIFLRVVLRGRKRASVVFAVMWALLDFPNGMALQADAFEFGALVVLAVLVAVIYVGLLVRVGLLAALVMQVVVTLMFRFPVTTDFSAWHSGTGFVALAAVAALAAYGFRYGVERGR